MDVKYIKIFFKLYNLINGLVILFKKIINNIRLCKNVIYFKYNLTDIFY